jgi:hypothetical protein
MAGLHEVVQSNFETRLVSHACYRILKAMYLDHVSVEDVLAVAF